MRQHFQLHALFSQPQGSFTLSKKQIRENPNPLFCKVSVSWCSLKFEISTRNLLLQSPFKETFTCFPWTMESTWKPKVKAMQVLFIQTGQTVQFSNAIWFLIMPPTRFENFEYHNISYFRQTANIQGWSRNHHIYMAMEEKSKEFGSAR